MVNNNLLLEDIVNNLLLEDMDNKDLDNHLEDMVVVINNLKKKLLMSMFKCQELVDLEDVLEDLEEVLVLVEEASEEAMVEENGP